MNELKDFTRRYHKSLKCFDVRVKVADEYIVAVRAKDEEEARLMVEQGYLPRVSVQLAQKDKDVPDSISKHLEICSVHTDEKNPQREFSARHYTMAHIPLELLEPEDAHAN